VLIGAPGAGKGTQADRLAGALGLCKLSTGDLLREAIRLGTELGRAAEGTMREGALVGDDVILELVREELETPRCARGAVLDGFPRNLAQAEGLDRLLGENGERLERVLFLKVDEEEVVRRLSGRRICQSCGRISQPAAAGAGILAGHVATPAGAGRDSDEDAGTHAGCGGRLVQRADDRPETVRRRLQVFREQTAPLLELYARRGLLREVDGGGEIETVHERLLREVA
jgi:adenylate kinase